MSVLRAILHRVARLLVRLARTIDPGLALTPYWAIPERIAALRRRYPDAPDHWLHLVARHVTLNEGQAVSNEARAAEPHEVPPERHDVERPSRPAPRFPNALRRVPAMVKPIPATVVRKPTAELRRTAPSPLRPALTFATPKASAPADDPVLLGRSKRRSTRPSLVFDVSRKVSPAPAHNVARGQTRRGRLTRFPRDQHHCEHHMDWPDLPSPERGDLGPRWPSADRTFRDRSAWPQASVARQRPEPSFDNDDRRWPKLPALLDEAELRTVLTSDEAALLAEQIGGTWSA